MKRWGTCWRLPGRRSRGWSASGVRSGGACPEAPWSGVALCLTPDAARCLPGNTLKPGLEKPAYTIRMLCNSSSTIDVRAQMFEPDPKPISRVFVDPRKTWRAEPQPKTRTTKIKKRTGPRKKRKGGTFRTTIRPFLVFCERFWESREASENNYAFLASYPLKIKAGSKNFFSADLCELKRLCG